MKEKLCFSIDNKNTKAIDDVISIEQVESTFENQKCWKIGVHISAVNEFVKPSSAIDKDAKQKVQSTYVGKHFFKSMLPRGLYQDIGSLKENAERIALTQEFLINEQG